MGAIFYPKSDSLHFIFEDPSFHKYKYYEGNPSDFQTGVFTTINPKANNRLKVIVFRDSYTKAIYTFMSGQFYSVKYVWKGYDINLIKAEKPDIVIASNTERYFY